MKLLFVICIIIFLVCIVSIFFLSKYHAIISILYKVNLADKKMNDSLSAKSDLIIRCIGIIERQLKIESKTFTDTKKLKGQSMSNIDRDELLEQSYLEIMQINEDYNELDKVKSFPGIIEDLNEIEANIISLRTYYNKYTAIYNNYIAKFPNNLVALIKKLKKKNFYENTQLGKDNISN
ncbi:MAG: LemA family protein [Bacilli bacterium]